MGKQLEHITPELKEFIQKQKIFFVGTARQEGRVNVSPKGMDTLRVLGPNQVIWLNLTGSGNETAAHLLESKRMTLMFSAFEGKAMILRLYGQAEVYHERDAKFQEYLPHFPEIAGSRQIMDLKIDLVQTSCGFAVPEMEFKAERRILEDWATKKGKEGIEDYWKEKNQKSLDGFETQIIKPN